uniref:hypothetical protein n=1 Tax=Candidatus Wolbachia massiliensis TaxID=1845000 RepID=UPI0037C099FA
MPLKNKVSFCRDENGIVEMQVAKTKGFEKRYAAKQDRLKILNFIAIAAVSATLFNAHDLKDFYFTFIELPKFPKTKEDQLENIVEKCSLNMQMKLVKRS